MSKLKSLKNATTVVEIAALLDVSPSRLTHTLYKLTAEQKYRKFEVPKKSGGTRLISAPVGKLKSIQRALADLLNDCRAELLAANPRRALSHGFRKALKVDGGRKHKKPKY